MEMRSRSAQLKIACVVSGMKWRRREFAFSSGGKLLIAGELELFAGLELDL
jgi:hypothetical protein